jgi:hypothetical protein
MKRRKLFISIGTAFTAFFSGCTSSNNETQNNQEENSVGDSEDTGEPSFDVRIESFDHEVEEGETASFLFSVENTGDAVGTQDVLFEVDNQIVDSYDDIELEPGEVYNNEFTLTPGGGDAPEVNVAVRTANDVRSRQVEVIPEPPVEDLEINITDVQGFDLGVTSASATVILEIQNTNSELEIPSPTIDYNGYINDVELTSAREDIASLGPGDSTMARFELIAPYDQLGEGVVTALREETFTVGVAGTVESEGVETEFDETYRYN